jgi:hypothetical protein
MTEESNYAAIPGTGGLPDNLIHRASLWLERLKFGERAFTLSDPQIEAHPDGEETFGHTRMLLESTGLAEDLSPKDVRLAALYYGSNMRRGLFGNRLQLFVPNPAKGGEQEQVNMDELFGALWMDAFEHGLATHARLYGHSKTEEPKQT